MMIPPTDQECSQNAAVSWINDNGTTGHGFADWYPSTGGYVGRCVVEIGVDHDVDGKPDGFNVWIWHDGNFPTLKEPRFFHHCSAQQFIRFGTFVAKKIAEIQEPPL